MGPHLMKRPPKYVHGFIDRHGKPRFYFRRAGFKKEPLPGLPWSGQFMGAYEQAMAGQPASLDVGQAYEARLNSRVGHQLFSVGRLPINAGENAEGLSRPDLAIFRGG